MLEVRKQNDRSLRELAAYTILSILGKERSQIVLRDAIEVDASIEVRSRLDSVLNLISQEP